ncbi:hypothetical protein AAC387_Pa03g2173 [Persea americana]
MLGQQNKSVFFDRFAPSFFERSHPLLCRSNRCAKAFSLQDIRFCFKLFVEGIPDIFGAKISSVFNVLVT